MGQQRVPGAQTLCAVCTVHDSGHYSGSMIARTAMKAKDTRSASFFPMYLRRVLRPNQMDFECVAAALRHSMRTSLQGYHADQVFLLQIYDVADAATLHIA